MLAAPAALAEELAAAWRQDAAGTVAAAELPERHHAPAPAGVFIPLASLGLRTPIPVDPVEAALRDQVVGADVVVVHVEALDSEALHEGPLPVVARLAVERGVPVVVLAGRAEVSRREWSVKGVSGVHEVGTEPAHRSHSVTRVARTWAPKWSNDPRTTDSCVTSGSASTATSLEEA